MLGSIKGNSFYMTLVVLGCITIGIVALLTLCFCCCYCCRPGVSSRGSSKDALTQEDGEFRYFSCYSFIAEYLGSTWTRAISAQCAKNANSREGPGRLRSSEETWKQSFYTTYRVTYGLMDDFLATFMVLPLSHQKYCATIPSFELFSRKTNDYGSFVLNRF